MSLSYSKGKGHLPSPHYLGIAVPFFHPLISQTDTEVGLPQDDFSHIGILI
jgi:hypothetical protein